MQKRKKHLLGLAGLALVGAMTVAAYAMPTSEAAAVSTGETTVRVSVGVDGEKPAIEINSFTYSGTDSVFSKKFNVTVSYSHADKINVYLKNNGAVDVNAVTGVALYEANAGSRAAEYEFDTSGCPEAGIETQTCTLEYDLSAAEGEFDPAGTAFLTRAVAINSQAAGAESTADDEVAFIYRSAFLMGFGGEYMQNGDPSMEAILSDEVKSAVIAIYDENGNEVQIPAELLDADGRYHLDLTQKKGNSLKFALPLYESGAKSGKYQVVLMAYDTENITDESEMLGLSLVKEVSYKVKDPSNPRPDKPTDPNVPDGPNNPNNPDRPTEPEKPVTPETPDTGLNLFKDLNISRADYIITGLIAFGMVTAFAAFLMIRRSKR